MPNTAVLWIRDGVLVDRMHINPVAFAFATWIFSTPELRKKTTIETLINFGFEKSGLSCAEKIRMYNSECEGIVANIEPAASYYNDLASVAAKSGANYFNGAIELLQDLKNRGVQNFITSAVEQDVLSEWYAGQQGREIAPYMCEVLGGRENFSKGRDHFEYVFGLGNQTIYYVADAVNEIQTGAKYSRNYNILPVGFGNVISVDRVLEGVSHVKKALLSCGSEQGAIGDSLQDTLLDVTKIELLDRQAIQSSLIKAGAQSVVEGTNETIMPNLRQFFERQSLLSPNYHSAM